jgi:hypothetical protein
MNTGPLLKGLRELGNRTPSGELAYLCLNGKSENHIRDLVSFNIARAHPKWLVQREVDRIDLTLTPPRTTPTRIEFKLGYSAVVAQTEGDCPAIRGVKKDLRKRRCPIVACLGLMHFEGEKPDRLDSYRSPKLIQRSLDAPDTRCQARRVTQTCWPTRQITFVSVDCGRWDGLGVFIDFAVISPSAS